MSIIVGKKEICKPRLAIVPVMAYADNEGKPLPEPLPQGTLPSSFLKYRQDFGWGHDGIQLKGGIHREDIAELLSRLPLFGERHVRESHGLKSFNPFPIPLQKGNGLGKFINAQLIFPVLVGRHTLGEEISPPQVRFFRSL